MPVFRGLHSLGDGTVLRHSLRYCGNAGRALGKFDEAKSYHQESLALSQAAGRQWDIGIDNAYLGSLARRRGALERPKAITTRRWRSVACWEIRALSPTVSTVWAFVLLAHDQPIQARALAERPYPSL